MTDVKGRMFSSCRRSPWRYSGNTEARLLGDALQELDVPSAAEWS